jgi:hypothetical protein
VNWVLDADPAPRLRELHIRAALVQHQPAALDRQLQASAIFSRRCVLPKQKRRIDLLDVDPARPARPRRRWRSPGACGRPSRDRSRAGQGRISSRLLILLSAGECPRLFAREHLQSRAPARGIVPIEESGFPAIGKANLEAAALTPEQRMPDDANVVRHAVALDNEASCETIGASSLVMPSLPESIARNSRRSNVRPAARLHSLAETRSHRSPTR